MQVMQVQIKKVTNLRNRKIFPENNPALGLLIIGCRCLQEFIGIQGFITPRKSQATLTAKLPNPKPVDYF